ncbi:MAG TPA: cellulase family glycosylhydrolase [Lacipirellulaceae bacterium]|nr:cellulase family glycosylhydrolase [Lacipirellulaceae bacterium]
MNQLQRTLARVFRRRLVYVTIVQSIVISAPFASVFAAERWTSARAHEWYAAQQWLVGCNFAPSTAINQLEMWQAETFDPETIDRELGWAKSIGINTVRVFLHDVPWHDDREGFIERVDKFLEISARHDIRPMVVLFDGVWDPDPQSGPQRRPRTGVHNSGWVQSPGRVVLAHPKKQDALKPYVTDVIKRYANDDRVLAWDLFNEPDNPNSNSYGPLELKNKDEVAARLVRLSFDWSRAVGPKQPLTVGVWRLEHWDKPEQLNQVHRAAVELSDIISFHDYGKTDVTQRRIAELKTYGRPLLCTEFMARGNGSTFEGALPIFKKEKIAAYCWGLVDGKTNTKYPWSTWQMPILREPDPWHHEIFHTDGRPYREAEVKLIRELTGR